MKVSISLSLAPEIHTAQVRIVSGPDDPWTLNQVRSWKLLSTTGKWSGLGFSLSCYLSSSQKWTFEVYIHYIGSWLSNTKGFDFFEDLENNL